MNAFISISNPGHPLIKNFSSMMNNMAREDECICWRPKRHVLCSNCGNINWGRIRYLCPKHPRVLYMNDYTQCTKCHMSDFILREVKI